MKKIILSVEKNSIAEELNIEASDKLVSIDGQEIIDVFDYRMAITSNEITLLIEKANGEEWLLEIEKDEDEDLGLVFETGLMDNARMCKNNCIFCFIHQNPADIMRKTIYFKDDDYRLSFLHGNYITLTNMKQQDIDRILKYHISPINISIHTTDPNLRVKIMGNKNAGENLKYLDQLAAGGTRLSLQIVLCKNFNDGKHLDKTIYDLSRYVPKDNETAGYNLSVVPAGLTKYREENGLTPLQPHNAEDCLAVIKQIEAWQERFLEELGTRFVYAADEFYIKSGVPLPAYEAYEDFAQIENGVGLMTAFRHDFDVALKNTKRINIGADKKITIVTGMAAHGFMQDLCRKIEGHAVSGSLKINVAAIRNDFFGENVTVAGLLTGKDIIKQLKERNLGQMLLLPATCLRSGEEVLLDDVTIFDIQKELGVEVCAVNPYGDEFVKFISGGLACEAAPKYPQTYEKAPL